jgi:hypothetical protein
VEAIQTTKPKHVDHFATFTCLYRRSSEIARHAPKANHLITSQSQYQHHHTNKTNNNYTLKRPKPALSIYRLDADHDSSIVPSLLHRQLTIHSKILKIHQMIENSIIYNFFIIRFGIKGLQNSINIILI